MPAAFDVALDVACFAAGKIKINTKVKGGGQECPPYTPTLISPSSG